MRLDPARFAGPIDGRAVELIVLRNESMELAVCNHGARILQLIVPDRDGRATDVVLGHDSLEQMLAGMPSMGAFIGRYANRIAHARFDLDGRPHFLPANDGPHCVHGGPGGSRHQVFQVLARRSDGLDLSLQLRSAQDGFPGDVDLQLRYQLKGPALIITFSALVSGAATPLSLTSHPFFDLDGGTCSDVLDHELQLDAQTFVPVGVDRIPLGHFEPVVATAFDFRRPRRLRSALGQGHPQLNLGVPAGFDHAFWTPGPRGVLRRQARLQAARSGVALEVWSDAPALQLYTSAPMDGSLPRHAGKGGRVYRSSAGVCLEPQQLPDAPNQFGFGDCMVRPGQVSTGRIEYRLSVSA
jgi:aldose 1-epimerase